VNDPPRLVEWHLIGNVGLGMSDTRVEYTYGSPFDRYTDRGADWRNYRGRGQIDVAYDRNGRVTWVSTRSSVYRTAGNFGVGSPIPLGRCHRVNGKCVYRWRFFTLTRGEGGVQEWVGKTRWMGNTVTVALDMKANRVDQVELYIERPHVCYPFYVTCDGVR
jgi:hypothetical protein